MHTQPPLGGASRRNPWDTSASIIGKMKIKAFPSLVLMIFLDFSPSTTPPTAPKNLKLLGLPQPPAAPRNVCGPSSSMGQTVYAWGFLVVVVMGHRLLLFSKLYTQRCLGIVGLPISHPSFNHSSSTFTCFVD